MMNRLDEIFIDGRGNKLNIYFTAGYPDRDSLKIILPALQEYGADMVEIGMPYSDPVADGPVIQNSNAIALQNGMSMSLLFEQLNQIKSSIHIPVILMGYLNPVMQYGIERFCADAESAGVSGVIIPDLPMYEYEKHYQELFIKHSLHVIFLISPETSAERIKKADKLSKGFLYAVSSTSTTGEKEGDEAQQEWYERIKKMNLKNKVLIGFGIKDQTSFENACNYAGGAIIGSAFIKALNQRNDLKKVTREFVQSIKVVNKTTFDSN